MPQRSGSEPPVVSFLSDYGLTDEFVGVCKAVILRAAPSARIIDVTHGIPPFDVRAGALALARAVQYLPPGVVLAVVDPGVGSDRRAVAVEVETGFLVGPDNGLLAPAVAMLGGATRAVSLTNPEYQLEAPGATFAGRDVFAPAAGYLAAGTPLEALGELVDPMALVPGMVPLPRDEGGRAAGEVLWVDRYGNAQLNIDPGDLAALGVEPGGALEIQCGKDRRTGRWVGSYAEAGPFELAVVVDSYGLVSITRDRRAAAEELGLQPGSAVTLGPVPPGGMGGVPPTRAAGAAKGRAGA
ncbi:MAG TPA: SAM-dependent chlorinase/fluorinase [Acidimicrobiia bacterium]|nr:SAM-dependent chlorinase/fluorinase [Acidimicrobiia bacterium]HMC80440.1 SAM-dependent chlorinase/fluorinase [Acidimicrobiia bacterium]